MKTRIFFIAGIMGLAVVSGICRSLSSPRGGAKKEEEEKAREQEESSAETAEACD